MRIASSAFVVAGAIIAGVYAVRAATGARAGWAYDRGARLTADARHAAAIPLLDRAAHGGNRNEALWLSGEARLGYWDGLTREDRSAAGGQDTLRVAAVRFLEGRAGSPGSGWFTSALADVYARRELESRAARTVDLAAMDRGPWALVGIDGRIAIGLTRAAIDRQPNSFEFRDQLVLLLEANGLHAEALLAMEDSARVLPDFGAHPDFVFEGLPRDLVERFWRTSRALDPREAPLQFRERQLLSLGQLARRLGYLDEAEEDLRAALSAPGTALFHAEDAFHLALVLVDRGRLEEAESMLARAAVEPVFRPGVAETRARIAEQQARWGEALDQLRELRALKPRDLGVLVGFARVAQKNGSLDQAEEALRWAIVVYPGNPVPRRALFDIFVAQGDKVEARRVLDEYVRAIGTNEEAAGMERALSGSLDPVRR